MNTLCNKCNILKSINDFGKGKNTCKECRKQEYIKNRIHYLEKAKLHQLIKKEELKGYYKKYYEANKKEIINSNKNYYINNKKTCLEKRKIHYENSREEINERAKELREIRLVQIHGEKILAVKGNKFRNQKLTYLYLRDLLPESIKISKSFRIQAEGVNLSDKIYIDFSFEKNNKRYLIEYNGRQHYEPVNFNSMSTDRAFKRFKDQEKRDNWLRNYASENKLELLEIDGRDTEGTNIKSLLERFLKENKII